MNNELIPFHTNAMMPFPTPFLQVSPSSHKAARFLQEQPGAPVPTVSSAAPGGRPQVPLRSPLAWNDALSQSRKDSDAAETEILNTAPTGCLIRENPRNPWQLMVFRPDFRHGFAVDKSQGPVSRGRGHLGYLVGWGCGAFIRIEAPGKPWSPKRTRRSLCAENRSAAAPCVNGRTGT